MTYTTAIEKPEKKSTGELDQHGQAYILHRLGAMNLDHLGQEAKHGQEGSCPADHLPDVYSQPTSWANKETPARRSLADRHKIS
jgi:hypothetical protein